MRVLLVEDDAEMAQSLKASLAADDHEVEIATGRVQILDMPETQAKEVAAIAAKTDGIIFHLWPDGAKAPNGEVGHPQSVGHKHRME